MRNLVLGFACVAVVASVAVADDVLVLDENGRGATGRFRVLDHEGEALGLMVSAEDKFVAAASTAKMEIDGKRIVVTIDNPVPEGMTVEKRDSSAWAGDGVELFIRPSMETTVYYQYSANAAGKFAALRNLSPDVPDGQWKTRASAEVKDTTTGFAVTFSIPFSEVFQKGLRPGDAFGLNFTRCGKTCSGLSTWAAVGGKFSNIDAFGKALYGGTKAYFARRLADVSGRAGSPSAPDSPRSAANGRAGSPLPAASAREDTRPPALQRTKVVEKIRELTVAIEERGGDPAQFAAIEKMFADVDKAIISEALAGKSILLFRPNNPWGNKIAPDETSRPIETVRMRAARNSRAVAVFAAANLTDKPFVGQFKIAAARSTSAPYQNGGQGAARPTNSQPSTTNYQLPTTNCFLSQGFAIADRVGRPLYDPIMPLPMNSLLRLAPGETVPIYLELDTQGLAAGSYKGTLSLKKAMPGFTDETVALEVRVADADLDEVAVDRAGYDYVGSTHAKGRNVEKTIKLLVDRGYNVVYVNPGCYSEPREGLDGKFRVKDFSRLDRHLDAVLAAGLPRERMKLWVYMALDISWWCPMDAPGRRCVPGDGKWEKGVQAQVRDFAAHVKEKYGIGKDRIYWYTVDEPSGDIDAPPSKSKISRTYYAAKTIKEEDPANLTMTDPLPTFLESKAIDKALPRLAEVYDVIELYRPAVTDEKKRLVAAQNLREVWTYSIIAKETSPAIYRRDYWENMRDGYREIATFWHMTAAAGSPFDSGDFTKPGRYDDYASLYVDFENDAALLSRRQLAADMGFEETRLVMWLRKKAQKDAALCEKVNAAVKASADGGTMSALDTGHERLLELVGAVRASMKCMTGEKREEGR